MVRALISDASMQEWVLVCEVLERYGIGAEKDFRYDDDETGWPDGDLDLFADDGLPADQLRRILTADDLWADEMVTAIATRLGFADELAAAVGP
jgi:putative tRNA adenosine deaminase-associated protein